MISGANPITYLGKDGKQYVAVAAGTTLLSYTLAVRRAARRPRSERAGAGFRAVGARELRAGCGVDRREPRRFGALSMQTGDCSRAS